MTAFYNEHDPFAAAWLRELIKDGLIAPGVVDERSIEDITPDELRPFQQCHFFAGIGVWSLAARRAGIADDAPLWSGSCPCQPFSAAGQGGGFADERHLWPAFHYLIEQCRPPLIVGEQVAGADGDTWFDLVSADLDATAYAFGVAETVACGFGAPHKRTRNYWVAYADQQRQSGSGIMGRSSHSATGGDRQIDRTLHAGRDLWVADAGSARLPEQRRERGISRKASGASSGQSVERVDASTPHGLADHDRDGQREGRDDHGGNVGGEPHATNEYGFVGLADSDGWIERDGDAQSSGRFGLQPQDGGFGVPQHRGAQSEFARKLERPGPVNGLWHDADWLRCRDERWRAVEPGTFPLADAGTFRNRVGLLRGAGNAVTLGQAQGFLEAVIASLPHENAPGAWNTEGGPGRELTPPRVGGQ